MGRKLGVALHHPYSDGPMRWYKGNLHTHTSESDGDRVPQDVVDAYASRNYDFLMLSDHDCLTPPESVDAKGMTLIPGNEVTADGPHLLHVNAPAVLTPVVDRLAVVAEIEAAGGLAIACHPNWKKDFNHCPQSLLEDARGLCGVEIYNGVVRHLEGSPCATDRWDQLLGAGRRIWGFANDDSHRESDDGVAWNMVQAPSRKADDILEALAAGRSYASTGVTIRNIYVENRSVTVEADNAERIVVVADYGRRLHAVETSRIEYTIPEDTSYRYVRIACYGRGESMAWTQPFFTTPAD